MLDIAALILPVFTVVLTGFLFAFFKVLPRGVIEALSSFIFNVGVPFLLFRTMQRAELPEASPWAYWAAFFIAALLAAVFTFTITKYLSRLDAAKVGTLTIASAYGNTVLLALPLILSTVGEAGAVPLFLLLAIHLPIMTLSSTILMESLTSQKGVAVGRILKTVLLRLVTHPIVIGLSLGLIWRLLALPMPGFLGTAINMLADAAVPLALFALGASLTLYEIKGDVRSSILVMVAKMIVHPALVWGLSVAFGLPPVWVLVNVLFAAAPPGINAFLFAQNYKAGIGAVSMACAIGTGLSVLTYSFWLWAIAP